MLSVLTTTAITTTSNNNEGKSKLQEVMDMPMVLIVVMISWVST